MFTPTEINGMKLGNRFVRSATWEGMATQEGGVGPKLKETYVNLAKGGVGLIISSHTYIRMEGKAGPGQLGIYQDELVPEFRELTAAVHENGGKIIMQLAHAGKFASRKVTGLLPMVVSLYDEPGKPTGGERHELTRDDIGDIVSSFAQGARRAKDAGFDGVQIHAAHGYLLSQFLSPLFNRRLDEYGGEIDNRSRILLEVYRAIRESVGRDYPVMIKLNCSDFAENGLTLEESALVAGKLADVGLDAVELSGGLLTGGKLSPSRTGIASEEEEAYFATQARYFKKSISIPLILVGGIRSFQVSQKLVEDGTADYISISRPLIREPGLINRWRSGNFSKSECKSDNLCFGSAIKGNGVFCETKTREEK